MAAPLIRNAAPKPAKGTALLARKARRRAAVSAEQMNKTRVRKLDGTCRWPRCLCRTQKIRTEVAHLVSKSRGGSDEPENLILLCAIRHQGMPSLHSGDLKIEPLDATRGTRGPCAFYERAESGRWRCVGVERTIGISEPRHP